VRLPYPLCRLTLFRALFQTQRAELASVRSAATSAAAGWERLRQERNEHRLLHTRSVQEKERLLLDAKRLRQHYAQVWRRAASPGRDWRCSQPFDRL